MMNCLKVAARLVLAGAVCPFAAAQPLVTISGSPLEINVGGDLSFQVWHEDHALGQIYPPASTTLADMGVFVRLQPPPGPAPGLLMKPWFAGATATSFSNPTLDWIPVSQSVSGTGTCADPWVARVVAQGALNLQVRMTVSYINGSEFFKKSIEVVNGSALLRPIEVYLGSDLYVASSDSSIPDLEQCHGGVGGRRCGPEDFSVYHRAVAPAATGFSGASFASIWSQINSGTLSNSVGSGCFDNGAALAWEGITLNPGGSTTIVADTLCGETPEPWQVTCSCAPPCPDSTGFRNWLYVNGDPSFIDVGFTARTRPGTHWYHLIGGCTPPIDLAILGGQPGCSLCVAPWIVIGPIPGCCTDRLVIPPVPALQTLCHQGLVFDAGSTFSLPYVTTQAVTVTYG